MAASRAIKIDGSALEGGGQILRNAIAYSCLLRKPIEVNNIRAGRSNPGLRPQHLCGAELIRDLCLGNLNGNTVGSTEITFTPGFVRGGSYIGDTRTAGSVCLMLQTALPCMMFSNAECELTLRGGTNADMAPQLDYMLLVTVPIATKFGLDFSCDIHRRGFYPKGGGEINAVVKPTKFFKAVNMTERGEIVDIQGLAFVAGTLPIKIANAMAQTAKRKLFDYSNSVSFNIECTKFDQRQAIGNGSGIVLVAKTTTGCLLAGSALGGRDKRAENVGEEAADELIRNLDHGGCVDEFLQDQLIVFMALAKGTSVIKCGPITLHTETAIHVARLLTGVEFTIDNIDAHSNVIRCEGLGLLNESL